MITEINFISFVLLSKCPGIVVMKTVLFNIRLWSSNPTGVLGLFYSALLVSDPKATSRCLQSPGSAALSVKRTAEIPVCQFKWHSPSSTACIFKSTAKCGKQGTHSYPLWKEHVWGAGNQGNIHKRLKRKQCRVDFSCYYPVLKCWLFHLLAIGLPVHLQPGRLQSACCGRMVSLEKEFLFISFTFLL